MAQTQKGNAPLALSCYAVPFGFSTGGIRAVVSESTLSERSMCCSLGRRLDREGRPWDQDQLPQSNCANCEF